MLLAVVVAPSAICNMAVACSALLEAARIERRSARSLFAIPSPAASSPARLIRRPEDSLYIERLSAVCVPYRLRSAFIAPMFVLILMVSRLPVTVLGARPGPAPGEYALPLIEYRPVSIQA